MRIIVTGATGFIGSAVVREALRRRWTVHGISLHGGMVHGLIIDAVDLQNEVAVKDYVNNLSADAIVHLAATIPRREKNVDFKNTVVSNSLQTMLMLEAADIVGAKKIVYASGSSIYGPGSKGFTEDAWVMPSNFYALTKLMGEQLCHQYGQLTGMKTISLRISAPYGAGGRHTVMARFIDRAMANLDIELWGSGKRGQDFTYIDDVTDSIFQALLRDVSGVFNIASGQTVTMAKLAKDIITMLPDCKSRVIFTGKPDPQEDYFPVYDLSRSRSSLGYVPKNDLVLGLRATFEAMFKENNEGSSS